MSQLLFAPPTGEETSIIHPIVKSRKIAKFEHVLYRGSNYSVFSFSKAKKSPKMTKSNRRRVFYLYRTFFIIYTIAGLDKSMYKQ